MRTAGREGRKSYAKDAKEYQNDVQLVPLARLGLEDIAAQEHQADECD